MKFNDSYFEQLGKSAKVSGLVKAKAESIASRARSTAPVDTGDYKSGIVVQKKVSRYRDVYLVVGTDPKTMLIEAKTANLLRALRAERK